MVERTTGRRKATDRIRMEALMDLYPDLGSAGLADRAVGGLKMDRRRALEIIGRIRQDRRGE